MNNETTASQPKSIGDDAQFRELLENVQHENYCRMDGEDVALIAFIDSKLRAPAAQASATIQAEGGVDWLGLALALEDRAKTVESQTTERSMAAAARGLRLMGAATIQAAPEDFDAWQKNPYTLVLQKSIAEDYVPRSAGSGVHADDIAVDRFAAAMKQRMAEMRAKGRKGWDNPKKCAIAYLMQSLKAIPLSQPVDVGNYAMMLFNRAIWENEGYPIAATIQEPVMVAEPVGALPPSLTFYGYSDENEHFGETILDYMRSRGEISTDDLKVGDVLDVTAMWTQDQQWRVVQSGNPFEVERILPLAAPMVADPTGVEWWRVRYLCKAILAGCVVDATKVDAQRVLDSIESGAATVKAVPSEALDGAASDVLAERRRQVETEGWTPEHDDKYRHCELARAAASYAVCSHPDQLSLAGARLWPFHIEWFKRTTYRRDLIKSGALILAEIERIDRAAPLADKTGGGE